MAGLNGTPSELEIRNAQKVKEYLTEIEGIGYKEIREDIFEVFAEGLTCLVDVEETIVAIAMEICDVPHDNRERYPLIEKLLWINSETVHGKFSIIQGKIVMQDNLEIENLDKNELEASLSWVFATVKKNLKNIISIIDTGEEGSDTDEDEIDFEDDGEFFIDEHIMSAQEIVDNIPDTPEAEEDEPKVSSMVSESSHDSGSSDSYDSRSSDSYDSGSSDSYDSGSSDSYDSGSDD